MSKRTYDVKKSLELTSILLGLMINYGSSPFKKRAIEGGMPVYLDSRGNRCPVGTYLTATVCRTLDRVFPLHSIRDIVENLSSNPYLCDEVSIEDIPLIVLDNLDFFSDIQRLHDSSVYWHSRGLTELGKEFLLYIIDEYRLDRTKFKFLIDSRYEE